jgi:hypothetical protein
LVISDWNSLSFPARDSLLNARLLTDEQFTPPADITNLIDPRIDVVVFLGSKLIGTPDEVETLIQRQLRVVSDVFSRHDVAQQLCQSPMVQWGELNYIKLKFTQFTSFEFLEKILCELIRLVLFEGFIEFFRDEAIFKDLAN